jgi:hypothetical protein
MIALGSTLRVVLRGSLLTSLAVGCSASVQGSAKTSVDVQTEPDPFARLNDPEPNDENDPVVSQLSDLNGPSTVPQIALLGARHDLQLQPRSAPSCSCMAFAVGKPTDPRFAWEDDRPVLPDQTSSVIAFSMVDGECASDVVASYRGYEVVGADVHILLETAVEGRPRLSGAVIPSSGSGRVVVVPPNDAPYGKSRIPGETRCVLTEGATDSSTRSVASTAVAGETSSSHITRSKVTLAEDDGDVPTSEEFDATPSEIPLDDGEHSLRDGFHLSMALGLEYPIARTDLGNGLEPGRVSGLGGAFDVFIGGNLVPGMAVGLTLGGGSAPTPNFDYAASQATLAEGVANQSAWEVSDGHLVLNGSALNVFRIGAFIDYYFGRDTNWHGLLTLGYASVSFTGGALSDSPRGFAAQAGLGYDFWIGYNWSLGILGRVMWAPLSSPEIGETIHVLSPNLGVGLTFH